MKTKTCTNCDQTKPLDQFGSHTTTVDGHTNKCSSCVTDYNRAYYTKRHGNIKEYQADRRLNNPQKLKEENAATYQKHRAKRLQQASDNYQQNRDVYKQRAKKWREDNPDRVAANLAKARATKKQAVPKWANITNIRKLYTEAQLLTESTGVKYQVDHIVPLNSKVVCGLHCEDNLRVITADENNSKNNKLLEELF